MACSEPLPSTRSAMATQETCSHCELAVHVKEILGPQGDVLKAVVDLDNELSADAEDTLQILDEVEDQERRCSSSTA